MTELIVTRGASGSGKTFWATAWVDRAPESRARIERDGFRQLLFGRDYPLHEDKHVAWQMEKAVTAAQQAAARGLLEAGTSVVISDTNLKASYVTPWARLAFEVGADFREEILTTSVEECIARNHNRERQVPDDVIREQHDRLTQSLKSGPSASYEPGGPLIQDETLRPCWVVDVDGTVALMDGRGPFEWDRVVEDKPNWPVVTIVQALLLHGYDIVFLSGRDEVCREDTERWLRAHVLKGSGIDSLYLFMRPAGNTEGDEKIKREIFAREIVPNWYTAGVLDDRAKVVRMWRSLGLTCAQVAPGAF